MGEWCVSVMEVHCTRAVNVYTLHVVSLQEYAEYTSAFGHDLGRRRNAEHHSVADVNGRLKYSSKAYIERSVHVHTICLLQGCVDVTGCDATVGSIFHF